VWLRHDRFMTTPSDGTTQPGEHRRDIDPAAEDRGLEEIGEDECFALLQSQDLGRLAIVRDGQPEIFPVNYGLDGHTVTIRTQPGVKLVNAILAKVAFEVEDIDQVSREGWVVEVRGVAEDISEAIDPWSERARATNVRPWVMGPHEHQIAISHPQVSGRRLRRPPPPT